MGCCPWGRTELDTTEVTRHQHVKIIYFLERIFISSKVNAINELQKNSGNVNLTVMNLYSTNTQCMLF